MRRFYSTDTNVDLQRLGIVLQDALGDGCQSVALIPGNPSEDHGCVKCDAATCDRGVEEIKKVATAFAASAKLTIGSSGDATRSGLASALRQHACVIGAFAKSSHCVELPTSATAVASSIAPKRKAIAGA